MKPFNILLVFLFLATASASPVGAQTLPSKEEMLTMERRALLQSSREAFEAGQFDSAIQGLILAYRQNPDALLLGNIGRSYQEAGDCHQAIYYFEAMLRDENLDAQRRQEVERLITDGEESCLEYRDGASGRLVIESEPMLAQIFVDEEPLATTPFEVAGLDTGSYEVRIERAGYEPYTETIVLEADQDFRVFALLQESEPERVDEPMTPPAVTPSTSSPNYVAYTLLGLGIIAAGTGAYFDLVTIPRIDEERKEANLAGDQRRVDELTARRQSTANLAIGGYVVGGLLAVGGASWLVYDHISAGSEEEAPQWGFTPSLHPQALGFQLLRRF